MEKIIELNVSTDVLQRLSGRQDEHLQTIEVLTDTSIHLRGTSPGYFGDDLAVARSETLIRTIVHLLQRFRSISESDLRTLYALVCEGKQDDYLELFHKPLTHTFEGRHIYPKTLGQRRFIEAMIHEDLVFASGPAGTGKTYLAVAFAVSLLRAQKIRKIILTRPAVEAGENLGFLPGDLKEKVDPYLRPLYDALDDLLSAEGTQKLMEKGVIEIAPLAYMRGRTLEQAMIILDEAQNATKAQIKMFLTRLGNGSKMVVTGDMSQTDLKGSELSGLRYAVRILKGIDGIGMVHLDETDVVRHPLVIAMIRRFEEAEKNEKILVIEDEESIRRLLQYDLSHADYSVDTAADGQEALEKGLANHYDLMLIDWMLPEVSGLDLVRHYRQANIRSVLVMLTAKDDEQDILDAFDAGVDDYVVKPFSPRQLSARIAAHLRRQEQSPVQIKETYKNLTINTDLHEVYVNDQSITLTKTEYELLLFLLRHLNQVLSREQILNAVWNYDYDGDTRIVDVHVFKLRSKLTESEVRIRSLRGVGYVAKTED